MVVQALPSGPAGSRRSVGAVEQQIRFCRSSDGVRIAYAVHGSGPPLVVVSCWLSHLQHDWQSPVWRHFLDDLGRIATVVRYDERGHGLSDWNVDDFTHETRLNDLQAVLDATGLERFSILGMSQGSATAMSYAARHPDRVNRLILYGTVCGEVPRFEGDQVLEEDTYRNMIRVGWAREDPEFRRVFTRRFIPDATEMQMRWFDDLQRMSTSAENALAYRIARQKVDIVDEIHTITTPTLILQAVGDRSTTFDNAVQVCGWIPGSRLVPLESRNHILLADEPAWPVFVEEVRHFMEPERAAMSHGARATSNERDRGASVDQLSARELEVLTLAAEGLPNEDIAAALGLSVRTIERHFSNIYLKLGVTGKAARAAAVAELLRREAHSTATA